MNNFLKNNSGLLSLLFSLIMMGLAYFWQERIVHPTIAWSEWQNWWQQSEIINLRATKPIKKSIPIDAALLMKELSQAQLAQYLTDLPKESPYKTQTQTKIDLNFRELPFDAWAAWMHDLLIKYPSLHIEELMIDRGQQFGCVNLRVELRG